MQFVYPLANMLTTVLAIQLPYVTGVLKLFSAPITFNPGLTAADLTAIESTFSGYAAKTLVALPVPFIDPINGGVSWQIPTQQWTRTLGTPDIGENVQGGWIENAGGLLLMAWQIQNPWGMMSVGDALPLDLLFNYYGSNQVNGVINGVPQ